MQSPCRTRPRAARLSARSVLLMAALAGLGGAPARAASPSGPAPPGSAPPVADPVLDQSRFIGVDEIRPGMRGVGRTTFSNRGVEEFAVEVLGVLKRWSPRGDLIVIEARGGPLAETGIYRGMSGSPIYLDGRLAGAVAYNLGGFAERPIAGVTPIGQMLALMAEPLPQEAAPKSGHLRESSDLGPLRPRGLTAGDRARDPDPTSGLAVSPDDVKPIATPLVLAGFTPAARAAMGSILADFGVETVSGGAAGAASPGRAAAIVPGSPVGVQLVRGDVEATALGTITHVDGDRVLAFGHPMFQAGEVDLPMTRAEVVTVYPSQNVSFVIGTAADPVGHVIADQLSGIAGRLGPEAPLVPMAVRVRGLTGEARDYRFEIVKNKFLLSQLVGVLALNSFTAQEKAFGDVTLDLALEVELADSTTLVVNDVVASAQAPASLAELVSAPVTSLLFNELVPVDIRRVEVEITMRPEIAAAAIDEVIVDQDEVEPGESIRATVFLNPHAAPRRSLELTIPVPADAAPGPALLRFCSADEAARFEAERAPRRFAPADVKQLIALVAETSSHQVMRVTLHGEARGVVVDGREMPSLPASVFRVMDSSRRTGGRSGSWGRLLHADQVTTAYQLSGCQELRLEIKGRKAAAGGREP